MKYKLVISLLLICSVIEAQTPSYFFRNKDASAQFPFLYNRTTLKIPKKVLDYSAIQNASEYSSNEEDFVAAPFQFGYGFDVDYTINDGVWVNDGNKRIWQLGINSPNAYSLNFIFSELNLIPDAELYIYNPDGSMVYGAVTANQNLYETTGQFLTDLISGDNVIIKLIEPLNSTNSSVIRISQVIHAYINIVNSDVIQKVAELGCHNDIACYPNWKEESNAVAYLIMGGSICTGALVINPTPINQYIFRRRT